MCSIKIGMSVCVLKCTLSFAAVHAALRNMSVHGCMNCFYPYRRRHRHHRRVVLLLIFHFSFGALFQEFMFTFHSNCLFRALLPLLNEKESVFTNE